MGMRDRGSRCVGEERTERVSVVWGVGGRSSERSFVQWGLGQRERQCWARSNRGYRGNGLLRRGYKVGSKGEAQEMLFGLGCWGAAWRYRDWGRSPGEQGCWSCWGNKNWALTCPFSTTGTWGSSW